MAAQPLHNNVIANIVMGVFIVFPFKWSTLSFGCPENALHAGDTDPGLFRNFRSR